MLDQSATTASGQREALGGGLGAGLVPSKTTRDSALISFAPNIVAERRIARLKRSVWASGHLHGIADKGHRPARCWFVTLTYAAIVGWKANHIAKALDCYRKWCESIGVACRYTWVAELQQRGAVHYHLLAWLPDGIRMPQWDRPYALASGRKREAMWQHGMTNTEIARAGVGYLMKYLSKLGEFHRFPKGLRLYGIGGLEHQAKAVRRWFNLPEWAKRLHGVGELVRHKAGLVIPSTGEVLRSPWVRRMVPEGIELTLSRPLPPKWHDGAWSRVSFSPI